LWILSGAILFAGVVAGGSRAGSVIVLAEVPAVIALAARRGKVRARTALLLVSGIVGLIAMWSFLAGWDLLYARFTEGSIVADMRWPVMRSSLAMLRDRAWTGVGYGAWPLVYPAYALYDDGTWVNQAHCDWLQWACEGGLPGLILAVWAIAALWKGLLRSVWGVGFIAVLCHAMVDYPFQQLPVFATFLYCAALLAALDGERSRASDPAGNSSDSPKSIELVQVEFRTPTAHG
jgi:O-antigen ligase